MSGAAARVGVGTRFIYDGEIVEVIEMMATAASNEVVLRTKTNGQIRRIAVRELLTSENVRVIPEEGGPSSDDPGELSSVVTAMLTEPDRIQLLERAAHVREVLTGYRSGSAQLSVPGEPRAEYDPAVPLTRRYAAKAEELGIGVRTLRRWVGDYRRGGEAGLVPGRAAGNGPMEHRDQRWVETALEVMVEHTDQSRPSRTMVIERANARVVARFGAGVVRLPSRATAFRILEDLERRHPTFRLSTKRNRDIAARPDEPYGKLRPTRPGEYLLMDTTRLDVFALDPVTLRWVQAELTIGMDWYTRCVVGIRLTPVSTKAVDAAATLYQAFRPRPAGRDWPAHAVWPEHGIPRSLLIDPSAINGPIAGAASPALAPETIVIDHGKIYVSEHLTSVCQRMGISIQPARLRTGRDKGPVERFFRTLREDLLQALPGYKGPDVHSRGAAPESEAFFYLDELEAIIREWVAVVYHHRPHESLLDPHLPAVKMSPAVMFEHGIARAGYIEVPRDPDLGYEFLKVEWRTLQHYGFEVHGRRYHGDLPPGCRDGASPYPDRGKGKGRWWPLHVDPDDITRIYLRDPASRRWYPLKWEHARSMQMPLSEDALAFARRLAKAKYTYPDDRIAVADLLERWNLGLGSSMSERRMALRMAREDAALDLEPDGPTDPTGLPSVTRHDAAAPVDTAQDGKDIGDDDAEDEPDRPDDGDFYADALEYL
ncbi:MULTISPECIES: helix-turn-helix domain-containing protein [unclassified Rhodococcus (in: high G+C Gram-positive bacteria)]|uniref:helix-turn-helix domain-containing protein n=1 Tax=unclassified Rhodococcus (in: high G+C Gram-positive bacteria) TaxID=192944 RepID=UPI00031B1E78|nr:helix-turn-helix domain-containing protein [Rhodococcus sp. DK17]